MLHSSDKFIDFAKTKFRTTRKRRQPGSDQAQKTLPSSGVPAETPKPFERTDDHPTSAVDTTTLSAVDTTTLSDEVQ
jgi:hypothetical protein